MLVTSNIRKIASNKKYVILEPIALTALLFLCPWNSWWAFIVVLHGIHAFLNRVHRKGYPTQRFIFTILQLLPITYVITNVHLEGHESIILAVMSAPLLVMFISVMSMEADIILAKVNWMNILRNKMLK